MKNLETRITIKAPAEIIWNQLINFKEYGSWNPFITAIEGTAFEGEKLTVTLQVPGKSPMNMTPKILRMKEANEFRWLGHLFVPGLFDGEHYFILKKINESETEFIHGEKFSGVFRGLIMKMISESTQQGFIEMNKAIKLISETNYSISHAS